MKDTGVVVIGMWDDHWCTAYKTQIDGLAPRLSPWLRGVRWRGATVFFVMHEPGSYLPNTVPLRSRHCACGESGTCIQENLPMKLLCPSLLLPGDWSVCHDTLGMVGQPLGIKRLLYVGAGVDHEMLFHPSGAVAMRLHYDVVLVRDMLLSLHAPLSIPLSHALSAYQIPSVMSEGAFA